MFIQKIAPASCVRRGRTPENLLRLGEANIRRHQPPYAAAVPPPTPAGALPRVSGADTSEMWGWRRLLRRTKRGRRSGWERRKEGGGRREEGGGRIAGGGSPLPVAVRRGGVGVDRDGSLWKRDRDEAMFPRDFRAPEVGNVPRLSWNSGWWWRNSGQIPRPNSRPFQTLEFGSEFYNSSFQAEFWASKRGVSVCLMWISIIVRCIMW
jgi:hypothetical protein